MAIKLTNNRLSGEGQTPEKYWMPDASGMEKLVYQIAVVIIEKKEATAE
jgi:hypothetical protein